MYSFRITKMSSSLRYSHEVIGKCHGAELRVGKSCIQSTVLQE
jgi:hypothetical protein